MTDVTFLSQRAPVDEYGRALYAVARSILSALLDQLSQQDLTDLSVDRGDVTMRQLSHYARLERDKGMRGDGFEWSVHEAIAGGEWRVTEIVADALGRRRTRSPPARRPRSPLSVPQRLAQVRGERTAGGGPTGAPDHEGLENRHLPK